MDKNPSPNSPPKNQSKNRATKIKLTLDQEQKFHLYTPKITTLHCRNRHPSTQKKKITQPLLSQPNHKSPPKKGSKNKKYLGHFPRSEPSTPPPPPTTKPSLSPWVRRLNRWPSQTPTSPPLPCSCDFFFFFAANFFFSPLPLLLLLFLRL